MGAATAGRVNGPKPRGGSGLPVGVVNGFPLKLCLSASAGFVSWRDTKSGSWYVETLDGVFEQWADSEDLQTLLLRVSVAFLREGEGRLLGGARVTLGGGREGRAGPGAHTRGFFRTLACRESRCFCFS